MLAKHRIEAAIMDAEQENGMEFPPFAREKFIAAVLECVEESYTAGYNNGWATAVGVEA